MRAMPVLIVASALTGCAEYQAENPALAAYPSIQAQIQSFYDANATEDDWTCNEVQLDTIDKSKVARQSANQVVIAVTYYFNSFDEGTRRGGDQCQGFNTRFFTFDKGAGGQLSLVSMTGPQRGVSG
ncbi:MAG: hypothetical protein U1E52_11605 [Geminicoccaceae bacterium]